MTIPGPYSGYHGSRIDLGNYSVDISTPSGLGNTLTGTAEVSVPGTGSAEVSIDIDKNGRAFDVDVSVSGGITTGIGIGSEISISGDNITVTLPNGRQVTYPRETLENDLKEDLERLDVHPDPAGEAARAVQQIVDGAKSVESGLNQAVNNYFGVGNPPTQLKVLASSNRRAECH